MILLELVYTAQFSWQCFLSENSYLKESVLWKHAENMAICYFILNLARESKSVLISLFELVQQSKIEKCVVFS